MTRDHTGVPNLIHVHVNATARIAVHQPLRRDRWATQERVGLSADGPIAHLPPVVGECAARRMALPHVSSVGLTISHLLHASTPNMHTKGPTAVWWSISGIALQFSAGSIATGVVMTDNPPESPLHLKARSTRRSFDENDRSRSAWPRTINRASMTSGLPWIAASVS